MTNLYLIIELHIVTDNRILNCTPVDGGIGTNFAVVANNHVTHLRNLDPTAIFPLKVGCETEAVGTNDDTGMNDCAHADTAMRVDRHARLNHTVRAYADIFTDHRARANLHAITDAGICTDGNEFGNKRAGRNGRTGMDDSAHVDAACAHWRRVKQLRYTREIDIGIGRDNARLGCDVAIFFTDDNCTGPGATQPRPILGISQKCNLGLPGTFNSTDTRERLLYLADGFAAQC